MACPTDETDTTDALRCNICEAASEENEIAAGTPVSPKKPVEKHGIAPEMQVEEKEIRVWIVQLESDTESGLASEVNS